MAVCSLVSSHSHSIGLSLIGLPLLCVPCNSLSPPRCSHSLQEIPSGTAEGPGDLSSFTGSTSDRILKAFRGEEARLLLGGSGIVYVEGHPERGEGGQQPCTGCSFRTWDSCSCCRKRIFPATLHEHPLGAVGLEPLPGGIYPQSTPKSLGPSHQ